MKLMHCLVAVTLFTTVMQINAQVSSEARDGLAAAVARGDNAAGVTQAELIAAGEIAGDVAAARALLTQAAQSGNGHAAYVLGVLAYRVADLRGAQSWWQQAAAGGISDAHYNLGLLFARDTSQTDAANTEFEAAARERHVLACFALGTRLADRDQAAARRWLDCAATQGYAPAQFNLAVLYAHASSKAEDQTAARRWYAAAAASFAPAASALAALPQTSTLASAAATASAAVTLRDRDWVMAQSASAYTVQVASGPNAEVLKGWLRHELHDGDAACVSERPASRQPYSAIVGVYSDRISAERASVALPAALRANTPWIRRYSSLQQALHDAAKEARPDADAHAVSN